MSWLPRCVRPTRGPRRSGADALAALAARATAMPCACGSPECPAAGSKPSVGDVVIHVLAEAATVNGDSAAPGYVPGCGGLSAQAVRQLARSAKMRPVVRAYLDDTEELLAASRIERPWALQLDVGLPTGRNLLNMADLDNYAYPLAA